MANDECQRREQYSNTEDEVAELQRRANKRKYPTPRRLQSGFQIKSFVMFQYYHSMCCFLALNSQNAENDSSLDESDDFDVTGAGSFPFSINTASAIPASRLNMRSNLSQSIRPTTPTAVHTANTVLQNRIEDNSPKGSSCFSHITCLFNYIS